MISTAPRASGVIPASPASTAMVAGDGSSTVSNAISTSKSTGRFSQATARSKPRASEPSPVMYSKCPPRTRPSPASGRPRCRDCRTEGPLRRQLHREHLGPSVAQRRPEPRAVLVAASVSSRMAFLPGRPIIARAPAASVPSAALELVSCGSAASIRISGYGLALPSSRAAGCPAERQQIDLIAPGLDRFGVGQQRVGDGRQPGCHAAGGIPAEDHRARRLLDLEQIFGTRLDEASHRCATGVVANW